MKSFSFSDLNHESAEVFDAALIEPVTLETRGEVRLVMMSVEEYEKLSQLRRAFTIENAPESVHDELMAGIDEILSADDAADAR